MKVMTELRKHSEADTLGWTIKLHKESSNKGTCVHHWLIESATGPTSKGTCKFCGEERVFQNYWDDEAIWEHLSLLLTPADGTTQRPQ